MAQGAETLLDAGDATPMPTAAPQQFPYPRQGALDSIAATSAAHAEALRRWGMPSALAQVPGILEGAAAGIPPIGAAMLGARAMQGAAGGQLSQEEMVRQTVDAALAAVGGGAFSAERGAVGVAGGRPQVGTSFAPQLRVARRMPNGEISFRGPGAVHSDLMTREELATDVTPADVETSMGYITRDGQFLDRHQALQYATDHEPNRAAFSNQQPGFGLEAATYLDPPRSASIRAPTTSAARPAPSLSPGFSRFEAERAATVANRLSAPPTIYEQMDDALRQWGEQHAAGQQVAPPPVGRAYSVAHYDRALLDRRITPEEHEGFMQALGEPAGARREIANDASAREFLRGRFGLVPAGEPQAWARMHGWSGQPGQSEQAIGPLGGNAAARAAFTRHIAPHMEESDFADKYFAGMHNPDISMARLYGYGSRGEGIIFDGPLRMGDKDVGQITRTIYPEVGEAKHGYLALDPSLQGSDIGKNLLANQVALYNRMGLKKVSLTANIDVGGYAWAKYGFLPDQDDWKELTSMLRGRLNSMNVPSEVAQPLRQILRSDDPRSMWSLADVKAGGGIGKQLLLGQNWHGSLDLKDPASMKRFTDYVLPKPKPQQ